MGAATPGSAGRRLTSRERVALAGDIGVLVRLHDREADAALLARLKSADPARWFSLSLDGETFAQARRLLVEALAAFGPSERDLDMLAAEYAAIYLNYDYQAAPTESVWRDEENLERQAAMFMTRAWYARYGVRAANWRLRSDDHIVNELEFLGLAIGATERDDSLADAARFLRDHLLVWIPEFASRVTMRCEAAFYAGAALLTHAYLEALADLLGGATGLDMTRPPLKLKPMAAFAPDTPDCGSPRGEKSLAPQPPGKTGHILFQNNADGRRSRI